MLFYIVIKITVLSNWFTVTKVDSQRFIKCVLNRRKEKNTVSKARKGANKAKSRHLKLLNVTWILPICRAIKAKMPFPYLRMAFFR